MRKTIFVLLFVFPLLVQAASTRVITGRSIGIHPNTMQNLIPQIKAFLSRDFGADSIQLVLEKGRYDFFGTSCFDGKDVTTIAFDIKHKKNLIIDGQGAEFIFHGQVTPFKLTESSNVRIQNLVIDWDRPYNSQGTIIGLSDTYVDIQVDGDKYPFEIVSDSIYFLGEGWRKPIVSEYTNIYEPKQLNIAYQTRDNPLGRDFYQAKVTQNTDGSLRFHTRPAYYPVIGSQIVFFHGRYIADGILIMQSKDIALENITIYHTLSCGVSGYKSENISLKKVDIITNSSKGRAFSTIADATHFNGCKGDILFDGCEVSGAGDDYMNIHGMYANVVAIEGDSSVLVAPNGRYIGFVSGEQAWVLDTATMVKTNVLFVNDQQSIYGSDGHIVNYRIAFSKNIRKLIKVGDLLENKDKTASLTVRNCRMLKKNRGRSILVSSPGTVRIENNYFNTAGAAILIEGDIELWNESGAVRDVLIQNNMFENCYTSGDNISDYPWGWGEAVISITPSVKPQSIDARPYHENIRIHNNQFRHFDYAILFARSVKGLAFHDNTLVRTYDYEPYYRKVNFYLDGCREVSFSNNSFSEDFLGKNMQLIHMRRSDVKQSKNDRHAIAIQGP
ncbi:hypothetical protein [Sphingobacterium sp. SYP-B4668]|uniref:hypothetical protein n=1 Tax=Sphingobacterium sp. SYP-B4668 TaxID=2996035 RepID=UPI0022DDB517|nr:hypothetical protein [Sphingobacterium sp. SYP-B4668]